jgi:uncharacterized membrane protein
VEVIAMASSLTVPRWTTSRWTTRAVWTVVIVLAVIGVLAVTRRTLDLAHVIPPGENPRGGAFDAGFAQQPVLTLLHILPGLLFMVLGPLQFVRRIRSRHLWLHRLVGRVYVVASVVIGVTGFVMGFTLAISGANEATAITLFSLLFLFFLLKGFLHARRREIARHREWMIRAYSIGLAVATIRPIIGLFFAFTTLLPQEFFGIAFWLGFTLHLIAAEVWINLTRPRPPTVNPQTPGHAYVSRS